MPPPGPCETLLCPVNGAVGTTIRIPAAPTFLKHGFPTNITHDGTHDPSSWRVRYTSCASAVNMERLAAVDHFRFNKFLRGSQIGSGRVVYKSVDSFKYFHFTLAWWRPVPARRCCM